MPLVLQGLSHYPKYIVNLHLIVLVYRNVFVVEEE